MRQAIVAGLVVLSMSGCGLWEEKLEVTANISTCGPAADADTVHLFGILVDGLEKESVRIDRVELVDADNFEVAKVRLIPIEDGQNLVGYLTGWPPKNADGIDWQAGANVPDSAVRAGTSYSMVLGLKQLDSSKHSRFKHARVHYEVSGRMRHSDLHTSKSVAAGGCENLDSL